MAEQTPNHPRPRVLLALAVLATAALSGVALFTRSGTATPPATKDSTSWYGIVRETVEILMAGASVAKADRAIPDRRD